MRNDFLGGALNTITETHKVSFQWTLCVFPCCCPDSAGASLAPSETYGKSHHSPGHCFFNILLDFLKLN